MAPTAPTHGEIGEGTKITAPIFEGTFTRRDVQSQQGIIRKGGTYAAPVSDDDIENNTAYLIAYTSFTDYAYQIPATGANGEDLLGRVQSINRDVVEVSADGGTQVSTLTNCRQGTVELFKKGQIIMLRVDGSGTPVALGDKLSLKAATRNLFVQDNSNGAFKALEAATGADDWIPAEVL